MNHQYILLTVLFWWSSALEDSRVARILDYQSEHTPTGHYFFRFESSDGIIREEEGNVLDENTPDSPVIVKGSYSYPDETGKLITVRYIADENGFHPEGDHISVPNFVNQVLIPSTPRPPRPQFIYSSTAQPEIATSPTRVPIPIETVTQKSIVSLLSSGNGRGFNVAAVNSI